MGELAGHFDVFLGELKGNKLAFWSVSSGVVFRS